MKEIPLTQGQVALVDDDMYAYLNQWKWFCTTRGYAARSEGKSPNQKTIRMHRQILGLTDTTYSDHKDGNPLNNQLSNLRKCTSSLNQMNRGKQKNNKSGYKGVCWHKPYQKWHAQITVNGKRKHLGYFSDILDAVRAYNKEASKQYGDFAKLNTI